MENFNFFAPTKILFGQNKVNEMGREIKAHGSRVLMVYGGGSIKKTGVYDQVVEQLKKNNIEFLELGGILPNPRLDKVHEGVKLCRENGVDFLLQGIRLILPLQHVKPDQQHENDRDEIDNEVGADDLNVGQLRRVDEVRPPVRLDVFVGLTHFRLPPSSGIRPSS